MLTAAQKVLALPKATPIYFYAGHGEDLCGDTNHKPILKKVPDNCIYITITECGMFANTVLEDNPREKLFRNSSTKIKDLLRHPYLPGQKKKLAELLELSSPSVLHIHYPGMTYVEGFFQPAAFWDQGDEGLWNNASQAIFTFSRSGLLDKSKMEANPKPYKEVTSESANSFYITKSEIVKFYTDSVYPTPEFVNNVLEATFPDTYALEGEDINTFILELVTKMDDEKLTNTYMMEHFPGIHYNMVCRSVGEDCEPEAELQRTSSGQQEQQREQKEIEEFLSSQIKLNNKKTRNKNKTRTQKYKKSAKNFTIKK